MHIWDKATHMEEVAVLIVKWGRHVEYIHLLFVVLFRELQCAMDSLKFTCSWKGSVAGARAPVKIGGLQLEGCTFDGQRLSENQRDSPIVSSIPDCVVAFIPKVTFPNLI